MLIVTIIIISRIDTCLSFIQHLADPMHLIVGLSLIYHELYQIITYVVKIMQIISKAVVNLRIFSNIFHTEF